MDGISYSLFVLLVPSSPPYLHERNLNRTHDFLEEHKRSSLMQVFFNLGMMELCEAILISKLWPPREQVEADAKHLSRIPPSAQNQNRSYVPGKHFHKTGFQN